MPKPMITIGQRFGRLVALERRPAGARGRSTRWLCRCDCGKTTTPKAVNLRDGITKSCGCAFTRLTHGKARTRIYRVWQNMVRRCNDPKATGYARYGGRGIEDRYPGFEAFFADMSECPPGCEIHRLNNDGHYEPGNCVWLPKSEHKRLHATGRSRALQRNATAN